MAGCKSRALECLLLLLLPASLALPAAFQSRQRHTGESCYLLQTGAAKTAAGGNKPLSAEFFGAYDQGESTYDFQTATDEQLKEALKSDGYSTGRMGSTVPKEFFAETPSAGKQDAWQTYPAVGESTVNRMPAADWEYVKDAGTYMQPYTAFHGRDQDPGWFDTSVLKVNGMGQPQLPLPDTAERLLDAMPGEEWLQRAVNISVTCKDVGCTARSMLQVFDPESEEAKFCRLTIGVHPTDYDNTWSKEFVKYWKVNDHLATGRCDPHAMGCNASAWRPLVPCVQDLGVDQLVTAGKGSLLIEGSINKMVDECPFEGNLLSSVAMVTCMTRKKATSTLRAAPTAEYGGASFGARVLVDSGIMKVSQSAYDKAYDKAIKAGYSPEQAAQLAAEAAAKASFEAALAAGKSAGEAKTLAGEAVKQAAYKHAYEQALKEGKSPQEAALAGEQAAEAAGLNANRSLAGMVTDGATAWDELLPGSVTRSNASLRCSQPGCIATTAIHMDPAVLRAGATCLMNVSVMQTDFDEAVPGSVEQIEYIFLQGAGNISTAVKPGRNPCTEEYSTGQKQPRGGRVFPIVVNRNVSSELIGPPYGQLFLRGKISKQVDDCASGGHLFDSLVTLECKIPIPEGYKAPNTTSTTTAALQSEVMHFNIATPVASTTGAQ